MSTKQLVGARMQNLRALLEAQSLGLEYRTYDAIKIAKWAWVQSTVQ